MSQDQLHGRDGEYNADNGGNPGISPTRAVSIIRMPNERSRRLAHPFQGYVRRGVTYQTFQDVRGWNSHRQT